ncbi:MAG: iron-sulfur cluster assembly accessory protein [Candidatus Latescibacteria bacterium]|nr:iron-sulfur cluster assembly accessory protein [Candidatus Latescibacterota bacterium]
MPTISEAAQTKINELIAQSEANIKGLRIGADAVSPLKVDYRLAFIGESQETQADTEFPFEGFAVYVDAASLPYVEEARIDFVDGLMGSGFKIERPSTLPPELSGPLVEKVQTVIEQQINPAVASHGGQVTLIDIKDNTVYVRLGGGCQGCGMADVTLKQGIEVALKASVPEIEAVLDVTDHADGTNPYYQGEQ